MRICLFCIIGILVTDSGRTDAQQKSSSINIDRTQLIAEIVDKLVDLQEDPGMWPYEGRYRVAGEIPVTYRVGGTSLVCLALMYGSENGNAGAQVAFRRGLAFILSQLDHPQMKPARVRNYDMRVLGQAYALLLLCHVQARQVSGAKSEHVDEWIPRLVDALVLEQMKDGGWNYQGRPVHASFVTASVVQSLLWAKSRKQPIPNSVFARARTALTASRYEDGAFAYFGNRKPSKRRPPQDRLPGSVGRSAICESILFLLNAGSQDRIESSLEAFYKHWDELDKRRQKPGTHEGPYLIAPYYFYYGHRYAAQAIELLPESARGEHRQRLMALLMRTRGGDGTWNDREFLRSRSYGTAMASLAMLSDQIGPPPVYRPQKRNPDTNGK